MKMNRRQLLQALGLGVGATALGPAFPRLTLAQGAAQTAAPGKHPWYELNMMADPILDQVLLFYLDRAWQQESDIGECLETASRVNPDDEFSWSREWFRTAERLKAQADAVLERGHKLSAGELALRASTYYRASLHRHPQPTSPDVRTTAARAVEQFERYLRLSTLLARPVTIPYSGGSLPAYFFRAASAPRKAPLLIVHQGRDAWAEDCKYIAEGANKRGIHCLLFDGPGQGKTLRLQGQPFRPDWEKVITPVVDYAISSLGVDEKRIGLMGISMGGILAPRAAAFEQRLKVLIANPGVVNWADIFGNFFAAIDPSLPQLAASNPAAFDGAIAQISQAVPLVRWGVTDTLWKHGVSTPSALMADVKRYDNSNLIGRITARTLVMDGTVDEWAQGERFHALLKSPKTYMQFTPADAAETHVQTGATALGSQRMLDWLEENI
jgi:alpha-beta hydrolase superfamily lysophospholipase